MSVGKRLILEQAKNQALQARMDVMRAERALDLASENVEMSDLRQQLTTARADLAQATAELAASREGEKELAHEVDKLLKNLALCTTGDTAVFSLAVVCCIRQTETLLAARAKRALGGEGGKL